MSNNNTKCNNPHNNNNNLNNINKGSGENNNNNRSNNNNRNNKYNNNFNKNNYKGKRGQIDELGNNFFDVGSSDQFERTTRTLADYVGKKYGGSMRYVIENHKKKNIKYPADLPDNATRTETPIYEEEIKRVVIKKNDNDEKLEKIYSIIWGQCTASMKAKLKTLSDYEEIKEDLDTIRLLINIKKKCYNSQDKNMHHQLFSKP